MVRECQRQMRHDKRMRGVKRKGLLWVRLKDSNLRDLSPREFPSMGPVAEVTARKERGPQRLKVLHSLVRVMLVLQPLLRRIERVGAMNRLLRERRLIMRK